MRKNFLTKEGILVEHLAVALDASVVMKVRNHLSYAIYLGILKEITYPKWFSSSACQGA